MAGVETEGLRFKQIDGGEGRSRHLAEVSALTGRPPSVLEYLLFDPVSAGQSSAFGILSGERLVGFQGWVHRPLCCGRRRVPTFRSEFTITLPELRGTGVFPDFYRWTMEQVRRSCEPNPPYLWGETKHRAWLKFGFRLWRRYTFYQVYAGSGDVYPPIENIMASAPYRRIASGMSRLPRYRASVSPVCSDDLPLDLYDMYLASAKPVRWRLSYDEEAFAARFLRNPFYRYEFWSSPDGLVIVQRDGEWAVVSEVLAGSFRAYCSIMRHICDAHERVVAHGNLISEGRTAHFWGNLPLGFVTLAGGGGFVEYNRSQPAVRLQDIPLYEAYHFGVPSGRLPGEG